MLTGVWALFSKLSSLKRHSRDIGYQKTEPVTIVLRGGAEPHALSVARRVPIPLQPKVKEELDRLQVA